MVVKRAAVETTWPRSSRRRSCSDSASPLSSLVTAGSHGASAASPTRTRALAQTTRVGEIARRRTPRIPDGAGTRRSRGEWGRACARPSRAPSVQSFCAPLAIAAQEQHVAAHLQHGRGLGVLRRQARANGERALERGHGVGIGARIAIRAAEQVPAYGSGRSDPVVRVVREGAAIHRVAAWRP